MRPQPLRVHYSQLHVGRKESSTNYNFLVSALVNATTGKRWRLTFIQSRGMFLAPRLNAAE